MLPTSAQSGVDAVPVPSHDSAKAASRWGKRLGVAAFLFFLVKGLAWLSLPAAAAYFASH
ncbi:MAG TPA: hypothetical protein VG797_11995 [Phycisphaerales bacterium]|nr:hypothetical protein [Phycisphaerales bacterium]